MATETIQKNCPFCGGKDKAEGRSIFEGSIYLNNRFGILSAHEVMHMICSLCGTVLNSRIKKKALCSCEVCKSGV